MALICVTTSWQRPLLCVSHGCKRICSLSNISFSPPTSLKLSPTNIGHSRFMCSTRRSVQKERVTGMFSETFPKKQRLHEFERIKDNLSNQWVLVFSSRPNKTTFLAMHLILILGVTIGIPLFVIEYLQREGEDDVVVGFTHMPAQTEILIIAPFYVICHYLVFRLLCKVPKRIYYDESRGIYKAILRTWIPSFSTEFDFVAQNIRHCPPRIVKVFKDGSFFSQYYKISSSKVETVILPDSYFRTGADYERMLWASGKAM